jgi:hypothetical protein
MPELPMAYEVLAHFEFQAENYKEALEWTKVALTKPKPKGMSIYDPTARQRAMITGALCEFQLGNSIESYQILSKIKTIDEDLLEQMKQEQTYKT